MIRLTDDDIFISIAKLKLNNCEFEFCSLLYNKRQKHAFIVYHNTRDDICLTKFNNTYRRSLWNHEIIDFKYECKWVKINDTNTGFDDVKFQEHFENSKVLETIHY